MAELVRDVDLLCLDAGNTIVFLDHAAMAAVVGGVGHALDPRVLERAEGEAKRRLSAGPAAMAPPLPDAEIPAGWSTLVRTMLELAGVPAGESSAACVRALWREHCEFNLWRKLPEGLVDAVSALRADGVPVCVVSNSEGRLQRLFEQLGIDHVFDLTLDSHLVGVEKPDPEIFRRALRHFAVPPERALHLGDVVATDVVGARAAGIRPVLIDPFGHYDGQHLDVPRVPSVAALARAIARARRNEGRAPPTLPSA